MLHGHRGADHGVKIVYGKNLIDFKMERSIENMGKLFFEQILNGAAENFGDTV